MCSVEINSPKNKRYYILIFSLTDYNHLKNNHLTYIYIGMAFSGMARRLEQFLKYIGRTMIL
jgi:hypothetical protein